MEDDNTDRYGFLSITALIGQGQVIWMDVLQFSQQKQRDNKGLMKWESHEICGTVWKHMYVHLSLCTTINWAPTISKLSG